MALSWSGRRQFLYTSVGTVVAAALLIALYEGLFAAPATCFDQKQDGTELGVDCGGTCALLCPAQVHDPSVLWARAFNVGGNYYTAAAQVQNPNVGAGAKQVKYSFQLFDAANSLIVERDGVVDIPPVQNVPIVEPNIYVGNRTVARTLFAFTDQAFPWDKIPAGSIPVLQTSQQNLSADGSRLAATLTNSSLTDAKNVTAVAVLYDQSGTARAASKSLLSVPAKSSVPLVFTWPGGVPNIVRAEITILPSF